ncbi:TraB/GumN family protein [Porphyromonas pogonae]|uniref:TraB/GumN family protein n=1 Tax=Porphyromonas pogonae TaxID=867595 RepID=UPI002E7914F3|nr:TraB/GumN family protein [Porphyromonas pogonae]
MKNFQKLLFFIVGVCVLTSCFLYKDASPAIKSPRTVATTPKLKQAKDDAVLWYVTGGKLSSPSYLLGTFHVVGGSYIDSIPGFKKAWTHVDRLVTEQDLSQEASTKIMTYMQAAMIMPADTTYDVLSTPQDLKILKDALERNGLGDQSMLKFRPSVIGLMLQLAEYSKIIDENGKEGAMDRNLQKRALRDKKENAFFEIPEQAARYMRILFTSKSLGRQYEDLLNDIKSEDSLKRQTNQMILNYKHGYLHRLSTDIDKMDSVLRNVLVYERNQLWLEKIIPYIESAPTLIAVGSGHLVGKEGLIEILRSKGYKVTPILK